MHTGRVVQAPVTLSQLASAPSLPRTLGGHLGQGGDGSGSGDDGVSVGEAAGALAALAGADAHVTRAEGRLGREAEELHQIQLLIHRRCRRRELCGSGLAEGLHRARAIGSPRAEEVEARIRLGGSGALLTGQTETAGGGDGGRSSCLGVHLFVPASQRPTSAAHSALHRGWNEGWGLDSCWESWLAVGWLTGGGCINGDSGEGDAKLWLLSHEDK